jgi:hypothetical protein
MVPDRPHQRPGFRNRREGLGQMLSKPLPVIAPGPPDMDGASGLLDDVDRPLVCLATRPFRAATRRFTVATRTLRAQNGLCKGWILTF